jgi:membrane protease subunit HflK
LGVEVVLVGLQDLHPPAKVAPVFQEVLATLHETEGKLHQARGYSNKTVTLARADAQRMINEAGAFSNRTVQVAAARAAQFTNQITAFHASPEVFMERAYLQALERGITNSRRFVIAGTNKSDIIQYDLTEKIRGDLLNELTIPPAR